MSMPKFVLLCIAGAILVGVISSRKTDVVARKVSDVVGDKKSDAVVYKTFDGLVKTSTGTSVTSVIGNKFLIFSTTTDVNILTFDSENIIDALGELSVRDKDGFQSFYNGLVLGGHVGNLESGTEVVVLGYSVLNDWCKLRVIGGKSYKGIVYNVYVFGNEVKLRDDDT
jgi:hypothetical protein